MQLLYMHNYSICMFFKYVLIVVFSQIRSQIYFDRSDPFLQIQSLLFEIRNITMRQETVSWKWSNSPAQTKVNSK